MNVRNYLDILEALDNTGVFVVREDDKSILYFNKRVKHLFPTLKIGDKCSRLCGGQCITCPTAAMGKQTSSTRICFDNPFGRTVDITATRIMWDDVIPAFVISVTPHPETASYTYDKILKCNLTADTYEVLKISPFERYTIEYEPTSLSGWMKQFALRNLVFPDDADRFEKFVALENLRSNFDAGKEMQTCTYRRKTPRGYRWHTLEIVADANYSSTHRTVLLYVKDVHDAFHEGLESEQFNIQNMEVIKSLGEQNYGIYVIDLRTGMFNPIRTAEDVKELVRSGLTSWDDYLYKLTIQTIHKEYQQELLEKFSLDGLRSLHKTGEKRVEMIAKRDIDGVGRYISTTAHFRETATKDYLVVIAFQNVDERIRKERKRKQADVRMSTIIKSQYEIMTTVDLNTGMCERIRLRDNNDSNNVRRGNYSYYLELGIRNNIYEEDAAVVRNALSFDNLRKMAALSKNYFETTVQYRLRTVPATWVEDHVLYIRQDGNTIVNILGKDITAEKLKEEAAESRIMEKAYIINSLSSMFFATYYADFDKDTFRTISQWDRVGEVLGEEVSCTEALELYAKRLIHPDDREKYLTVIDFKKLKHTLSLDNPIAAVEYRRIKWVSESEYIDDGWIRSTAVLAELQNGKPKTALLVAQDVTDIKRKEEMEHKLLKEAYDATTRANASKSDFLSRMSHDIRTPMNAIIGMTEIAKTHMDNPIRVTDCLNKITVSGKHLLGLINEVLDVSKIESGKIDLSEEEFHLSDLIHSIIGMIQPAVLEKHHKLTLQMNAVRNEEVVGDTMRLRQVFTNILGNSVKYTPQGGLLEVEVSEKPSHIYGYGCYEFIFRDNGIGMPKDFVDNIFEPFSRAENARQTEGTGLGMTIAHNIVRMMNGNISINSTPGKGSEFIITLFLKQQATDLTDLTQLAGMTVLVVDDSLESCETTCNLLEEIGMKGEWIQSGAAALPLITKAHEQKKDFFAIMLDWKMPIMDGIETAKAIRRRVGPSLPIIIISAYDWTSVETDARQAGVSAFISKPLFKSRLVYLFKKLISGDQPAGSSNELVPSRKHFPGKRVLLVEDNELNREIAEEIISQAGITVDSVTDGKQALERFLANETDYYDLIFMDIQMPVMNGLDAATAIRHSGKKGCTDIPIIAMTANAFAEDAIASQRAGMNEHITKPLSIDRIMQCLEYWLGNS